MADTIKTNLGPVTAYADAKAHGYTGTREEFGVLLANAGLNLKAAETAKADAEAAKQAAETAQQAAAENQKNAGTQAANAKASADTAAEQAAVAEESAADAANSATAAQESETNAGLSATAAANAEAAAKQAQNAAETAKADAETAKTAAGNSADAAANSAADAKKTLESIPADYSTLSGKVNDNTSLISEIKEDFSNQQIKKYNAVTLGCKNDGSTDCSKVIQNILDNNVNIIIYFPVGTYRFDSSLYVRKDSSCQIIGETFSNDIFYINSNDIPVAKNGTVLWFNSSKTNISFINVQAGCISFRQKEICLYSKNGLFECDSDLNDRPHEPYNPYRYVSNISGQNGVSVVDCTKVEIDECAIIGFTSCGLALYTTNIVRDTYIRYCAVAIELKSHDISLYDTYITQCKGGVKASGGNTIFAHNIWIDQCVEYGVYKFGKLNGIITGLIDHCGYSGIRLDESDGLRLDLRMGRCGMYYAASVEDIKGNSSELAKSAFIKIGTCKHGEFTLSLYERSIGDDEINEYMLPKIVLAGTTWENVCVIGLNAEENYDIFSDTFSTGTNITCYTSKGIISKKI